MKTGVIYARYSSDKQTEQSIEGQVQVCKQFADENKIKIVNIYADRALTGKSDDRPEFLRMIKDSAKKQFDYVIVYKLDRFARNRYVSAKYNAVLKKNNVKRLSATENIADNNAGVFMEGILEAQAEYFSLELSEKVSRGMAITLQKGRDIGGHVPYGYDRVNGFVIVNPERQKNLNIIFDLYIQHKSASKVRKILKQKAIFNQKGKPFSKSQIYRMVRNEKYIGKFVFQNVEYNNVYPPLIDENKFQKAQSIIDSNYRPRETKDNTIYYLTGKLFYGNDNKMMSGVSGTSKTGTIYRYYQTFIKTENSKQRISFRKDLLEQLIVDIVLEKILTKNEIEPVIDDIVKVYNEELKDDSQIRELRRNRTRIKREIKNLIDAVKSGIISTTLQIELHELEKQLSVIEQQVSVEETKKPLLSKVAIMFMFKQFKKHSNKESFKEIILDNFVNKVKIINEENKKEIIIVCNLRPDNPYKFSFDDLLSSFSGSNGIPNDTYTNYYIINYHLILITEFDYSYFKRR